MEKNSAIALAQTAIAKDQEIASLERVLNMQNIPDDVKEKALQRLREIL